MAIVRDVNLKSRSVTLGKITDDDLDSSLLAAISESNGARVFTATPTPPYDVGDLWAQGSAGDLLMCVTARTADGAYSAADWALATKYTAGAGSTPVWYGGNDLVTDASPVSIPSAWTTITSISIDGAGVYDLMGGYRAGSNSYPTGIGLRLVTDSNGTLKLGSVANRASSWIGDRNTYSNVLRDVVTVATGPCVVSLQGWCGRGAYVNGASIWARSM